MPKKILVLLIHCFSFLTYYQLVSGVDEYQTKAESTIPIASLSPPEGNTTFLGGTTWCVAHAGASPIDLQNALDWACGLGMADCGEIQEGRACFKPDTLVSHASYAFNYFYQQNGNSDIACNFGGTATVTRNNPSYGKCVFAASGSVGSSAPALLKYKANFLGWKFVGNLLLLYLINSQIVVYIYTN